MNKFPKAPFEETILLFAVWAMRDDPSPRGALFWVCLSLLWAIYIFRMTSYWGDKNSKK